MIQIAQVGLDPGAAPKALAVLLVLLLVVIAVIVGLGFVVTKFIPSHWKLVNTSARFILCVLTLAIASAVATSALHNYGYFRPKPVAVWDFTKSHASSVVGWPTNAQWSKRDWWASSNYQYSKITIFLPSRPPIVCIDPGDVFFNRRAGQLTDIQINEDPITRNEALNKLRQLAKSWGFPWDEPAYQRWAQRANAEDPSSIGAGDKWNNLLTPYVGVSIRTAIGSPNRPWYLGWSILWQQRESKVIASKRQTDLLK